jgi:hypothetical protein
MKITKRQLRRIIKEETKRINELGISRGEQGDLSAYRSVDVAEKIVEELAAYDAELQEAFDGYGLDIQMLVDILDEVKQLTIQRLGL